MFEGNAPRLLIEIGRIVAADTLVNMLDRYPLIWDNDGNTENLLFSCNHDNIVAIDNRPSMYL